MKNFISGVILIFISVLVFQNNGCKPKAPDGPQLPVYYYTDPILNPPDAFQVMYDISEYGDRFSHITFNEDAVWVIKKLGDNRVNYWLSNDTSSLTILVSDTLGLKGGYTYKFAANNNNYPEFNNFISQFNKLGLDYNTFEPKF